MLNQCQRHEDRRTAQPRHAMHGDRRRRKLLLLLLRVLGFGGGGKSARKGGGGGITGGRGVGCSVSSTIRVGESSRERGTTGRLDEHFVDEGEPPIDHLLGRAGAIVIGHVKHLNARRFHFRGAVGGLADTHEGSDIVMFCLTQVLGEVAITRGVHEKETEFSPDDKGGFAGQDGGGGGVGEGVGMKGVRGGLRRGHLHASW